METVDPIKTTKFDNEGSIHDVAAQRPTSFDLDASPGVGTEVGRRYLLFTVTTRPISALMRSLPRKATNDCPCNTLRRYATRGKQLEIGPGTGSFIGEACTCPPQFHTANASKSAFLPPHRCEADTPIEACGYLRLADVVCSIMDSICPV